MLELYITATMAESRLLYLDFNVAPNSRRRFLQEGSSSYAGGAAAVAERVDEAGLARKHRTDNQNPGMVWVEVLPGKWGGFHIILQPPRFSSCLLPSHAGRTVVLYCGGTTWVGHIENLLAQSEQHFVLCWHSYLLS